MDSKKDLLFSIIIPVYQAQSTLRDCVSSCLSQKYVDAHEPEVILIDDGSTDGSAQLCDQLAAEDDRIVVRHTANSGVSHARNIGIELARGRFIVFVDSDDTVSGVFLSNMIKYADEETLLVDETKSYESGSKVNGFTYIENSVLNENTHVWGKLFDRGALNEGKIRFPEGLAIGEDLLFLIDFGLFIGRKHAVRCVVGDDYKYADNENSAMNSSFKKSYLDQIICWRKAEEKLLEVEENFSPYAFVNVCVSQILTALLVVGKVATQTGKRDTDLDKLAVSEARDQIQHALKRRGVFAALSAGHKFKVVMLRVDPELYLRLYAKHKN